MKKNIILGVILFLLITVLCSALYFIVMVDRNAKKNEEILKAQEDKIEISGEEENKSNSSLSNNEENPKDNAMINKSITSNNAETINIESKDDAQKVLEEASKITEIMDDIPF